MRVKILIGVAAMSVLVVAAFIAAAATRPSAYRVERKLEIGAPVDLVFAELNDLHRVAGVLVLFGSQFQEIDMQTTFDGPADGVGQSLAWSGGDVGTGKLTIEESVPAHRVSMKLSFIEPMESTATVAITLAGTPTGSVVTWSMEGSHNFIGKAAGMFVDTDNMLGADIESTLTQLRTAAERERPPP